MPEESLLSNTGVTFTEDDPAAEATISPQVAALLVPNQDRADAIGADLLRMADDRFKIVFGPALDGLRAAACELPEGPAVYVVGVELDMRKVGTETNLHEDAPGIIHNARLLFAYVPNEAGTGATFAHLTEDLDGVDDLLLALGDSERISGAETTLEAFRRELAGQQARRISLLAEDPEAAKAQFQSVFAAPLYAFEQRNS
ncbi:hypothetical protein ACFQH3_07890 [Haladaptatus sp. GCM10025707]|uniref:hypothetical protein n=1 Tax=unclassified Haladaptatus TaxID=2622732 RepID=UPI0023E7A710|nr:MULTISPECIES: hypothetical protein [unclassified Haladaptatus]